MPAPARLLTRFVALTGFALLAAFTLVDKGPSRALQWPWFLYAQLLWLSPVIWIALHCFAGGRMVRFGGGLDWALLAFTGANIVAAVRSPFPTTSIAMLPCVLAPVALAYAAAAWIHADGEEEAARRLAQAANAGAVFLGLSAAVSFAWWMVGDVFQRVANGLPWSVALGMRNERLLGHSNYTAGIGLLALAWLGSLVRERRGAARGALFAGALAGLAALFSSGSRGGFLALAVWLLWWLVSSARRAGWSYRRIAGIAALLVVVNGGLLLAQPRWRHFARAAGESGPLNMGDRQRLAMLEYSGLAVADRPLFGCGPGATPLVYPVFRSRLSGGVDSALQLHSTPLQVAAETGLVGLAALLAACSLFAWRALRRSCETSTFAFVDGSLVAYAALACTDYQLDLPFFAAAAGGGLALCGGATVRPDLAGPNASRSVAAVLVAGLGVFVWQAHPVWSARSVFSSAIHALERRDVAGYHAGAQRAIALAPCEVLFRNLHGLLLADIRLYPDWFEPVDLGSDRQTRAEANLVESLRMNPAQELAHFNLGWMRLEKAPVEAARHFRAAALLVPDKGGVYFGLGLALLRQGRTEPAATAFALELANDPAFVTSPAWVLFDVPPAVRDTARNHAVRELESIADRTQANDRLGVHRRAACSAGLLDWLGGREDGVRSMLDQAEPSQRELLAWLAGGPPPSSGSAASPWTILARAAAEPDASRRLLVEFFGARGRQVPTEPILDAIATALRCPDRRKLLLPDGAFPRELVAMGRRERTAYGLLMRNLDGPPPRDLYLVAENRIVRDFLQPLFPVKGYLPAPLLAAALARVPE